MASQSLFLEINISANPALSVLGFGYQGTNYSGKFNNEHHVGILQQEVGG